MIDELPPHAVFPLILQQRLHHLLVAFQDSRALRMIFGEGTQHFRHPGGHPPISSSPEKRYIRRMIEETVWLLEFVQIGGHLQSSAVEILRIIRRTIRL